LGQLIYGNAKISGKVGQSWSKMGWSSGPTGKHLTRSFYVLST